MLFAVQPVAVVHCAGSILLAAFAVAGIIPELTLVAAAVGPNQDAVTVLFAIQPVTVVHCAGSAQKFTVSVLLSVCPIADIYTFVRIPANAVAVRNTVLYLTFVIKLAICWCFCAFDDGVF